MTFTYYEKEQADQYSFIRIPKVMMTEEIFAPLSVQAKILYGLLLDKLGEATKHQWMDENNRAYVLYPIAEIQEDMNISKKKAMASLNELVKVGLVEKKLQGFGQPSMLYVKRVRKVNDEVPNGNL